MTAMLFKSTCYFPGENSAIIPLKVESDDWVPELLESIQDKLQSLNREVNPKDFRFYNRSFSGKQPTNEDLQSRALQWLHRQPAVSRLRHVWQLRDLFPVGPHRSGDELDIIVADMEEVLELIKGLGDPYYIYNKKIKKALDARLDRLFHTPLSDIVHVPNKVADLLGGDEPPIHLGRPGGAPAAIFNPALAILHQHLDHLEQIYVSQLEVENAAKYPRCAIMFYEEAHLQQVIKELVNEAIGGKGKWQLALCWVNNIKPDGSWWYNAFLILVLELKNMLDLSRDALLQAIVDYSKSSFAREVQALL